MNSLADHLLVHLSDLNSAMDELIENAGVFRTILDNAPVGVIAFDQNHFVKWFNPHYRSSQDTKKHRSAALMSPGF